VNSPPPKPEVILTNFFAEPTVLLVPITSRGYMPMEIHVLIWAGTNCGWVKLFIWIPTLKK
jgi:hypothetical protein